MYEYVITAGEGTMIELGVIYWQELDCLIIEDGEEIIIRPCDDGCETGQ